MPCQALPCAPPPVRHCQAAHSSPYPLETPHPLHSQRPPRVWHQGLHLPAALLWFQVRHIGVSNETSYGVMRFVQAAEQAGLPRIVSIQNSYSLLVRGNFETDLAEVSCAVRLAGWVARRGGVGRGRVGGCWGGARWGAAGCDGAARWHARVLLCKLCRRRPPTATPARPAAAAPPPPPSAKQVCAPRQCNVGLLAYSPLAGGALTGKYIGGDSPALEKARFNMFKVRA